MHPNLQIIPTFVEEDIFRLKFMIIVSKLKICISNGVDGFKGTRVDYDDNFWYIITVKTDKTDARWLKHQNYNRNITILNKGLYNTN